MVHSSSLFLNIILNKLKIRIVWYVVASEVVHSTFLHGAYNFPTSVITHSDKDRAALTIKKTDVRVLEWNRVFEGL